jgi:hypothetical protein
MLRFYRTALGQMSETPALMRDPQGRMVQEGLHA